MQFRLSNIYISLIIFTFTLLLVACQSNMQSNGFNTSKSHWEGMQERLSNLHNINISGRANFAHQSTRFSANFNYQASAYNNYTLTLTSSFGNELAKLEVHPQEALLFIEGRTLKGTTPRELFSQNLQIDLPLEQFHNIILALDLNDSNGKSIYAQNGFITNSYIEQFTINYRDYKSFDKLSIPSEFEITAPNLRILINTREVKNLE